MSQNQELHHILELSKDEKQKFINSFDIIFSDCDGVLWLATEPIKNADKAVNLLKNAGKQFICVSNNSMRTDQEYIKKLNGFGINDVTENNFVHPVKTIIQYLRKNNFNGPIFSIADRVFNQGLSNAGYEILDYPNQNFTGLNDFTEYIKINVKKLAKAVILDIDVNLSFAKLIQAQYFLQQSDCLFIIGASDKFVPLYKGFNIIGPDIFMQHFHQITGKEPIILGKPGKLLGQYLIENYSIRNPQRVLFIGDALPQDIGFGNSCNFQTLAVLSGATTKQNLFTHQNKNELPNFYADSLGDFIEFFKDIQNN